jgi:hypothetical protein
MEFMCGKCLECVNACCKCPPETRMVHANSKEAMGLVRAARYQDMKKIERGQASK